MHLVRISIEGLPQGRAATLDLSAGEALRKWTALPEGRLGLETLVAIAASIAPGRIAHLLAPPLLERYGGSDSLRTEFVCVREGRDAGAHGVVAGRCRLAGGEWERCSAARGHAVERRGRGRPVGSATPLGNLVLAYGCAPEPGSSDTFDFSDTAYPYRRISSLLDPDAHLTDPVRFLERIGAKAHELGTPRQKRFLVRLCRALASAIEPDERSDRSRDCPLRSACRTGQPAGWRSRVRGGACARGNAESPASSSTSHDMPTTRFRAARAPSINRPSCCSTGRTATAQGIAWTGSSPHSMHSSRAVRLL